MGWGAAAPALIKGGMGIFGALMGQGRSPEEEAALRNLRAQMERSTRFWDLASEQAGRVGRYVNPILSGSRGAAMEALAPEISGAAQRIDAGRQSLINLAPRSGGAAAMLDPYAKATSATNILLGARSGAAGAALQQGGMYGSWAQGGQYAPNSLLQDAYRYREQQAASGGALYDVLSRMMDELGPLFKKKEKGPVTFPGESPGGGRPRGTYPPSQPA